MGGWVLGERRSIARKRHVCDSCGRRIYPGWPYHSTAQIWEGEFVVFKSHDACRRAVDAVVSYLHPSDYEDGYPLVSSLESEDREIVLADDPEAFMLIWGDA